jgi:hypothetical protein
LGKPLTFSGLSDASIPNLLCGTHITAVYQYIVRNPEQFDLDFVCTLNDKIYVGNKQPIPSRGENTGDSQLRLLESAAKPENVAKLNNVTFLRFIPSAFSKKDHDHGI